MKRVQDPVHGLMEFRGMERFIVELLQTPEIQRLRRIRQLGLVHLVYPGAEHSRFVHALGSAFLAGRFARGLVEATSAFLARSVQPEETAVRDLMIAGLCHDLGHGPLSHVWEQSVVRDFDRSAWLKSFGLENYPWLEAVTGWHELVTQALILSPNTVLNSRLEALEKNTSKRVAGLLGGHYYLPYMTRLLSSDVDVDRADFVARDGYNSGVAYGRYDLDWMHSTLTVGLAADGQPVVGFDERKGLRVIEQFLIARQALYDIVYHHQTVRAAEQMVALLLRMTAERLEKQKDLLDDITGFDGLKKAISGSSLSLEEILALDDHALWVFIDEVASQARDEELKELAARVIRRVLFKRVPVKGDELDDFYGSDPQHAEAVVSRALEEAGIAPWYFVTDRAKFWFYHDEPSKMSFFVESGTKRTAKPIREHPTLRHLPREVRVFRRLFVPAEAVESVARAVERRGRSEPRPRSGG